MKTLQLLFIILIYISAASDGQAQSCESAEDWEAEVIGEPLQMSAQFGGYFTINGNPIFVEENCTPGGSVGLQLQAGIDGAVGDVIGYTTQVGINPPPTFLSGVTYNISGKKLLSDFTMGTYNNIVMTVTLVNGMGAMQVVNKQLMLIQGQCDSWDPPQSFVSPDDFDFAEITITANNDMGEDDLFIIIDDWCIEAIVEEECIGEFAIEQLDNCGKYQFTPFIMGGMFDNWVINGPNGYNFSSGDAELCHILPFTGTYTVDLVLVCEDGTMQSFQRIVEVNNGPPGFEACTDDVPVILEGISSGGECMAEYTIPDFLPFDDSGVFTLDCFLDSTTPVVAGQVVTLTEGPHTLFCVVIDECENESSCLIEITVTCDDDPCDYLCCEGDPNFPVEDLELGSLPIGTSMTYFPEYGDPQVIEDGCDGSLQGIGLSGVTLGFGGDAVGLRNTGTLSGPLFEEGNSYCINYCMKVVGGNEPQAMVTLQASTTDQTNAGCTGTCEPIGNSRVVLETEGWVTIEMIYTPTNSYDNLIFLNEDTGTLDFPSQIRIDNVCVTENPEPVACKVDLVIEEQECGKVVVNTDICGELEEMTILYDDGFESFEIEDTTACIDYTSAGPWTVTVNYICAGEMTIRTVSETFILENKINAPVVTCPGDTLINLDPEGECVAEVLLGAYTVDDPAATVQCFVSGILISDPTVPIQIPEGIAQVSYVATNECGADTCAYEIAVTCEPPVGKYDCPIDVLFVMDNSGSIDPSEYADMEASALAEITAISSVYTNSNFGVLHYSGECGETITIEHDFQPSASITAINRQYLRIVPMIMDDLNEALGATINALTGTADPNILSGVLTPDPSADLYVVIFTDANRAVSEVATGGCTNSALRPYTNSNILKNTFGANISVVHFIPGYADDVAAAIASEGGNYTGSVDTNPGDPTNANLPRQFIPVPFGTPNIDLLAILPPCEPCFDCDDLLLTSQLIDEEACCYSIGFDNGFGPDIVKMEAEIITPDWQFNTATTNPGSGFQWYPGTVTTGNKLCLTGASGNIPGGINNDILDYCFSPAVSSPSGPQVVVFKYYTLLGDSLLELQCTDTLETDCMPIVNDPCISVDDIDFDCNPENAYEYLVNLSVTNNSGFTASNITLSGLNAGFQFANCAGGTATGSIAIPVPGGLADGASTTICVKIIAPIPILNPTQACFRIGINSLFDCCHGLEDVCVTLDPCCDPCEDISTTYTTITNPDEEQCCYSIQVDYTCDYLYFNKIKLTSQTTGVTFGYHALGNTSFQMCGSSATELCLEPTASLLQKGSYSNVIDICLDGVGDPSQVPQTVKVEYLTVDPSTNLDTVACSEDITFECTEYDNECLEVTNQDLSCLPDSSKYRYTFTITNKSSIPFSATDVDVFIVSPTDMVFTPSGGTFPLTPALGSNQSQTISSCIESTTSTFPASATDIVFGYRLRYNAGDTCCYESVLDTIAIPPCDTMPSECFSVVDIEAKSIDCDINDCYENPYCQPWIVDVINNAGCFGISTASLEKAMYNGSPVFVLRQFYVDSEITTVYDCSGEVLQMCNDFMGLPIPCNPFAGINLATDLTSVQLVWDCSMPLPIYDPISCLSGTGLSQIDYCIKIMNNAPTGFDASQIDLNPLTPAGITVLPSTISQTIASGGMATLNFSVRGYLLQTDVVTIEGVLSGLDIDEQPWECRDTILLPVPECPVDECCDSEEDFLADVAQGFQITNLGDCTYRVCANQFDTCHWFANLGPDWGDGSVVLPIVLPSSPPNNCWTHQYTSNGTFKITLPVSEGASVEEPCWTADICGEVVAECCEDDPCEDVDISITQLSTVEDSCCTLFTIDNNFCSDYFKGLRVEMAAPATVSQISALNGYVVNQITPQIAEVKPLFGFIGVGVRDAFILCSTDYDNDPHNVTVSWLVPVAGDSCVIECPQDFEISCDIGDDDKCFEFVQDSIDCVSGTYCFKIKNISTPAFDINSVDLYDLNGTLGLSPSGGITIPTLSSGMTSDWICVRYFGVNPGDVACYKISAHNTPANLPPTTCCTDTIETCFTIPDCPQEVCGVCPNGTVGGPNMITNGDFEAGYTGFGSGYNLQASGLMGANQYSIRDRGSLVNTQWDAIDHTTGSTTGKFLAIDGPSGSVAYSTSVNVLPNTDYVFCMWVDNLVSTSTQSNPVIEVVIGGQTVEAGRLLPRNPDGWQLITLNYSSGTTPSPITIEVSDVGGFQYNDWAIDDVSFRACSATVDVCCDDLDEDQISDYYDQNIVVFNDQCQGCVTVDIDSCDLVFVDFGSGEIPMSDLVQVCESYPVSGTYGFTIRVVRLDTNGDTCYEETFQRSFDIDCPPVDDCCDVTIADILTYYGLNTVAVRDSCDICLTFPIDSCDAFEFRYDDEPFVSYTGSPTICKSYSDAGPHFYSYRITRFDLLGDTCFHDTFNAQFNLLCDSISDPDPCCEDLDVAALELYYQNATTFGTSECTACVIVDLDSCDVGTVTFAGNAPQQLSDNTQSCATYTVSGSYTYTIDIVRYDIDGDTCYHYQDVQSFDIECDDDPPVHPCVQMVADSIDCETNTYCFRVRNNTAPGWTIRSLAFVSESHTLTPDPVSIVPLAVGDTSEWICVDYDAFAGDTVCFNLVAHQEDLGAGEEPQFCCSNPEPVCFVVPDCQMCLMCPEGTETGPNLVANSDFEGGYTGFSSDYVLEPTGQLGVGSYSIRNSTNLGNTQWTAIDHTTNTAAGNFLVLDGPSDSVAYRTDVMIEQNTQYIFCMFVTNLVNSDIDSDPTIEVKIDGVVQIPGLTIPKQVGKWWIISVPYFSGGVSGLVSIEVKDVDTDPFNDWAIDDVSFRECIAERICCDDEEQFEDLLDQGWTVDISECSVTISAPQLDSCHWLSQSEPDWGDGSVASQVITPATGQWIHTYDGPGVYTICATIFEGSDTDDFCFSGEMCVDVDMSDCPEPPVPCDVGDITIYNAITPNGDGRNDRLTIDGGISCRKDIQIFNRWGQMVWSQQDYRNDWSGQSFSGEQLPDGTYFIVIDLPDVVERDERMRQTYIELRN